VVKKFIGKVRERAVGEQVIRSVTPGQQVVKIVHDTLVETLGAESQGLELGSPPAPILMVGLQGSGKTTTSAKLALQLQTKDKKRVLMASLDVNRPPPWNSSECWASRSILRTLPIILGQRPTDIAKRGFGRGPRRRL
jgi:signal recognition particle subunit SRP54